MKRPRTLHSIISLVLIANCMACQNHTMYHSYQPVSPTGWYRNDTLSYPLPFAITAPHSLQFEIGIRHNDTYPYRDIWLTVNQDTIHIHLADSAGYWKGSGIGNIKQHTATFRTTLQPGDSINRMQVTHIMQDNPLHGISDIGIRITEPSH